MPVPARECAEVEVTWSAWRVGAGPVVCRGLDPLGCLGHGRLSIGARLWRGDGWLISPFEHRS